MVVLTPDNVMMVYGLAGVALGSIVGFAIGLALSLKVSEAVNAWLKKKVKP